MLDKDMSPLGFDTTKMYNFISQRFINVSAMVQEQALKWLQTLTMLEIIIPLNLLFSMFKDGIEAMQQTNKSDLNNENMLKIIQNENGYHACKYFFDFLNLYSLKDLESLNCTTLKIDGYN